MKTFASLGVALAAMAAASPACAQALSRDDLLAALKQRDEAIAALQKRVDALEAEHATSIKVIDPKAAAAGSSPSASVTDDDVALQAMSRGLVQRGALVLPAWSAEATPSLAYDHSIKQGLVLVDTPEGISTVTDQRLRDDGVQAMLGLRLGLPWRSQLEVRVPYGWMGETSALGDGTHKSSTRLGLGDAEIELSHQFLSEGRWRPDLIGAVSWRFPTGGDPFKSATPTIASGDGVHQGTVRVTALKTADPMVFFATFSYGASLPVRESFGRVRPGDAIDFQVGGLLAVSPDTSLSLSFLQDFKGSTTVDGVPIAGSDQVGAVLQFGLDQVLTRKVLLDLSLGLGVTRDAPNYTFTVSVPIRFN